MDNKRDMKRYNGLRWRSRRAALLLALAAGWVCPPAIFAENQPEGGAVIDVPAPGSVIGADAASWFKRGALMGSDANFQGASDQLSRGLALDGDSDEAARFNLALAAMRLPGADAMGLLDRFLEDFPASPMREQALLAIADVWFDRGDYAPALRAYFEVDDKALNPSQAEALNYHLAYCLLKFASYDKAAPMYEKLIGTPYGNDARFYLGYIAYARGDYAQAARDFGAVRPDGMPTLMTDYYLAQLAFQRGDWREARKSAQALLSRSGAPADFVAEANRICGEAAYQLGDTASALRHLETYMQLTDAPLHSALYILGVEAYRNGNYSHAVELLTPVSTDDTAMGQSACLYIGQAYLKLDNFNAATLALEKACRMTHDSGVQETAFYNLAVARMQGGRVPFGSTVTLLEEFLQRYPDSKFVPQVADYVVKGYLTDNNYASALAAIEKVSRPGDAVLAMKQRVLYGLGTRELQSGDPRKALNHLKEAASLGRYDAEVGAEATLWTGECQYELGDYDGAIRSYNSYLRSGKGTSANRALARYDLGYARFARKQFADAAVDFSKFISSTPDKGNAHLMADAYNRLADCHYYAADFAKATENYGKAYQLDPASGDYPSFQQGLMKGLRRDHAGKTEALERMIEEFPSSALVPTALLEMGESFGELGRTDRQIETYTALASRYPSSAQGRKARLLLGITYLNAGKTDEAIGHYKRVITDYPSSDEARVAADDLKQIYADHGRVDEYVAFIGNVPDAPRPETAELARLTLQGAERSVEREDYAEAQKLAAEVVEKYPDSPSAVEALAIKADAEMRLGRSPQALASFEELERRASDAADINAARMGIMRVSRDMADNERVVEMADKLLASTSLGASGKSETAFTKAMALADLGRGDEAVAIWSELAADTDDLTGTKSAYYLARYHYDTKNTDKALEEINRLIDANPPHDYWLARGFILLSDILRRKGSDFEADEYLRSLRQNYPGNEADIFRMIDERLK